MRVLGTIINDKYYNMGFIKFSDNFINFLNMRKDKDVFLKEIVVNRIGDELKSNIWYTGKIDLFGTFIIEKIDDSNFTIDEPENYMCLMVSFHGSEGTIMTEG